MARAICVPLQFDSKHVVIPRLAFIGTGDFLVLSNERISVFAVSVVTVLEMISWEPSLWPECNYWRLVIVGQFIHPQRSLRGNAAADEYNWISSFY